MVKITMALLQCWQDYYLNRINLSERWKHIGPWE